VSAGLALCLFAPALALGSVLNTLASRLPERRLGAGLRPSCRRCGALSSWHESIAVLSHVFLHGRCGCCGARKPLRYPLVELATGGLVVTSLLRFGLSGRALLALAFCGVVLVLAAVDVERGTLPNRIAVPAAAVVLALHILVTPERGLEWVLAALAAALGLLAVALAYRGAVGIGDVKLAFLLGAGLGKGVLFALVVAVFAAFLAGLAAIARRGFEARKETIPFSPFLALGAFLALFLT